MTASSSSSLVVLLLVVVVLLSQTTSVNAMISYTNGLCCLCENCRSYLLSRNSLYVDSQGNTCNTMALQAARSPTGSQQCSQAQQHRDECCNPYTTPTSVAQAPRDPYPNTKYLTRVSKLSAHLLLLFLVVLACVVPVAHQNDKKKHATGNHQHHSLALSASSPSPSTTTSILLFFFGCPYLPACLPSYSPHKYVLLSLLDCWSLYASFVQSQLLLF